MVTSFTAARVPKLCRRFLFGIFPLLVLACTQSLFSQSITLTLSKADGGPTQPIPSGQQFTYTLAYGWSGGGPGTLTITDIVPAELDVISTLPAATITGNTVVFNLAGLLAGGGAGTVQINVRFKPGVTCPGTIACNRATVSDKNGIQAASNNVCDTATATNRWTFKKTLFAGCALDNDVIFQVCVINPSGGDIGGLNLTNISLADVVPLGATVTSVAGNWTSFTQSGTNVTLSGGPSTLAVSPWNLWYCVYIHVTFPSVGSPGFTVGQTVKNRATLSYMTPCDTTRIHTFTDSANVTLCAATFTGNIWKSLSINMFFPSNPYYQPSFSPGCCGTYTMQFNNTGSATLAGFTMTDNPPATVDVTAIRTNVPAGNTPVVMTVYYYTTSCPTVPSATQTYNVAGLQSFTPTGNVCKVVWSYGGSIALTQSVVNYLDVCVRPASYISPFPPVVTGQNITNTVTAQASGLAPISASVTKAVDSLKPKILATKFFVGKCTPAGPSTAGPWVPGDTVRWRMAIANVGNVNATPCTITDNLPVGLKYVGNPTYFYGNFNWMASPYNPPCNTMTATVPAQIGGTITSPLVNAQNLTWNFATLPFKCDGTVDYLIIEFDVRIDTNPPAPPGQYFNAFTFSATNLSAPSVSNQAQLTVNAIAQLTLSKGVRLKGTIPFSPTIAVPAGSAIEFGLRLTNTGNLKLGNICLLDIMPHSSDVLVLPGYSSRGSSLNLPVTSAAGPVNAPAGFVLGYNVSTNTQNPRRLSVCSGFCGVAERSGTFFDGPITAWSNQLTQPFSTFSFNVSTNTVQIPPGGTLDVTVPTIVPSNALFDDHACNNFAVSATPVGTTTCLATQSLNACVTIGQPAASPCDSLWLSQGADSCCGYHFTLAHQVGAVTSVQYNVLSGGVVQSITSSPCPPSSTVPISLFSTTSGTLNYTLPCNSNLAFQVNAASTGSSGRICIEFIITIKNGSPNGLVCRDTICFNCPRAALARCDSMYVKPFPYVDLQLSGRTFTLLNMKVPASPICSVKIKVVPPPGGPGLNGGGLYIDNATLRSWPYGSSSAYTQILAVHGMPANNFVRWNLGIDYTIGWVGTVTVTAYHCDGDSCSYTYGPWAATKGGGVHLDTAIGIAEKANLRIYRLAFPRTKSAGKNIRSIAIRNSDPVQSIVAVTGGSFPCDTSANCDDLFDALRVKDRIVMVELRHALDSGSSSTDPAITVLYTASNERHPTLEVVYYDGNGQEIGHDSTTVIGGTLGTSDPAGPASFLGSLNARPNPTTGRCDVSFTLQAPSKVDLDILDMLGNRVSSIITGEQIQPGDHTRTADMSALPNGSYLISLRVNGAPTVVRVELVR